MYVDLPASLVGLGVNEPPPCGPQNLDQCDLEDLKSLFQKEQIENYKSELAEYQLAAEKWGRSIPPGRVYMYVLGAGLIGWLVGKKF